MSDCSKHKKEVAGISDMKVLAEAIGDLHYEALTKLFQQLQVKIEIDCDKDMTAGRTQLGWKLFEMAKALRTATDCAYDAWAVSKPFMGSKNSEP
jgi:hypothetical protein